MAARKVPDALSRSVGTDGRRLRRVRRRGAAGLRCLALALPMSIGSIGVEAAASVPTASGASQPLSAGPTAGGSAAGAAKAASARYAAVALSDDGHTLTVVAEDGHRFAAARLPEQVGFASPHVSADGRFVGWLATFDGCCQSYAVPQALVVLDGARRPHTFRPDTGAPFAWCFVPGGDRVGYMHTFTHGSNAEFFELVRIADGRPLAHYEYPDDAQAQSRARAAAPSWVRCVPE